MLHFVFGFTLALSLVACSSSDAPKCADLRKCCQSVDPAFEKSCNDAIDRANDDNDACGDVLQSAERSGWCSADSAGEKPIGANRADGGTASQWCVELRQCCNEHTSANEVGACLAILSSLEQGTNPEEDCRATLAAKVSEMVCYNPKLPSPEVCNDGVDNDQNNFTDCADFACRGADVCEERGEERCQDNLDNDQDGFFDCQDRDCAGFANCKESLFCDDGIDNDANNHIDCDDFACADHPKCAACSSSSTENDDVTCSDGCDNDQDGYRDCEDFSCSRNSAVTVCGAEDTQEECSDGVDNDFDKYIDCEDRQCAAFPNCANNL